MQNVRRLQLAGVIQIRRLPQRVHVAHAKTVRQQLPVAVMGVKILRAMQVAILQKIVRRHVGRVILQRQIVVVIRPANVTAPWLLRTIPAHASLRQPFTLPVKAKLIPFRQLVVNVHPADEIAEHGRVRPPIRPRQNPADSRRVIRRPQPGARVRRGSGGRVEQQEVKDGVAEHLGVAHPQRQRGRAAGGRICLNPADGCQAGRIAAQIVVHPHRPKDADEIRRPIMLAVAVPGRPVGVAQPGGAGLHARAEGVQQCRDHGVPKRVAAPIHLRAAPGRIRLPGRVQSQHKLRRKPQRIRPVQPPFRRKTARRLRAQHVIHHVQPRPRRAVQIRPQLPAGVIRRVQGHAHQPDLAHVGQVIVVGRPARAHRVADENGVIDNAHRLRVVIGGHAGVHVLVRPAQEHLADGRLVLRREVGVNPVHRQGKAFAPPAGAVVSGKSRVAEGLIGGRPFGCLVHHVHEQRAGALGVVGARGRVIFNEGHEGEEHGVHFVGVLLPGDAAAVPAGQVARIHLRFGAGGQNCQPVLVHRVAGNGPGAQPGQIAGAHPEAGMAAVEQGIGLRGGGDGGGGHGRILPIQRRRGNEPQAGWHLFILSRMGLKGNETAVRRPGRRAVFMRLVERHANRLAASRRDDENVGRG